MKKYLAAAVAVLAAFPAQAVTFTYDLSIAAPADRVASTTAIAPVTISNGDVIDITFRRAGGGLFEYLGKTTVLAGLDGAGFNLIDATYTFTGAGALGETRTGSAINNFSSGLVLRTPTQPDVPFAFETIRAVINVTGLRDVVNGQAVPVPTKTFDTAYFRAVSFIPEPGSWAMIIAGFGLVGGMLRSTRRTSRRAFA